MTLRELVEQCAYLDIAVVQKEHEKERGIGPEWTDGYRKIGCYDCDGKKTDCIAYEPGELE